MKCPYCGHADTKVIDSRPAEDGGSIRRRRSCDVCGKRFTTYEKVETIPLIIIKKDNNREQYDRSKIEAGILRALEPHAICVQNLVFSITKWELPNVRCQRESMWKGSILVMRSYLLLYRRV